MNQQQLLSLLKRYDAGTCSKEESVLLERWFAERSAAEDWHWESEEERLLVQQLMRSRIEAQLFATEKPRRLWTVKKIAVAASIFLCFLTAIGLYVSYRIDDGTTLSHTEQAVEPGSQAAFLTLADGSTIRLDDAQTGTLFDENGVAIKKLDDGELLYEVGGGGTPMAEQGNVPINTISIPRGGQYQLILPDGTKVRLNSASTLVYPNAFVGDERVVSLTGEAYFEVAKNEHKPFKVKAGDTEIQVTGTHFNINAYADEQQVTTTLVEGGINVLKKNQEVALQPGQQAVSRLDDSPISIETVDTDYALAWLEGDFVFENQDIKTIMKNIARWYNVDVIYESSAPTTRKAFGGTYTKSKGIEELLSHLETLSNNTVRFKLKERRVTVIM
ncbi:FecR family protein [Olivibacter sp. SDN3]|uniref:FecR family protein n=1 Tax=Olivibacter sp. SDN3 TaxID=2764720 RepID=UPI001651593C|nr:FecR family protein [Olivibacter sp. SDN3]QNL51071.1 FecR family protein [Olivibacter sp. SDN3]